MEAANGHAEAEWLAARVRRLQRDGHDLREIAVLFRVHILSRVIEQALVRRSLSPEPTPGGPLAFTCSHPVHCHRVGPGRRRLWTLLCALLAHWQTHYSLHSTGVLHSPTLEMLEALGWHVRIPLPSVPRSSPRFPDHCLRQVREGIPYVLLGGTPFWGRAEASIPATLHAFHTSMTQGCSHAIYLFMLETRCSNNIAVKRCGGILVAGGDAAECQALQTTHCSDL